MGFRIRAWGDYALFSRPELKVERYSYDVITPSAARGILDAVYWHPGMKWVIDRIYVVNPIRFLTVKRNELTEVTSYEKLYDAYRGVKRFPHINRRAAISQRASTVLCDVEYVIDAHFIVTDEAAPSELAKKFSNIIARRLEKGQFYHMPCFGCREFPAHVTICNDPVIKTAYDDVPERDFGLMLYDLDFHDEKANGEIEPLYFRAVMKHGVLDLDGCEVIR